MRKTKTYSIIQIMDKPPDLNKDWESLPAKLVEPQNVEQTSAEQSPELRAANEQLERARQRLLSAAIAFCDGSISAGQLRAVREFLRSQEANIDRLTSKFIPPFAEEPPATSPLSNLEVVAAGPLATDPDTNIVIPQNLNTELKQLLLSLDKKNSRLERDFQQGRVNAAQYRAIRKHYSEQREIALRMGKLHPENELWRVVLEEGKTSFLMQLNEAQVYGVAFFNIRDHKRLFHQGVLPPEYKQALSLITSFGIDGTQSSSGRMFATQTNDGKLLLLIPGQYTVALIIFSQEPPGWQVRALREVHSNFEAMNKVAFKRGKLSTLIFPDLSRFIRTTDTSNPST